MTLTPDLEHDATFRDLTSTLFGAASRSTLLSIITLCIVSLSLFCVRITIVHRSRIVSIYNVIFLRRVYVYLEKIDEILSWRC